ncbi:UDP-N-acetylglucosamine 1-carboxyvinyltransferase [Desulfonatronospira thiodismutans ASO3-1]|uniref:UDP-N-acetylglucosamine 1-carboxyvinyltransferase n=1 Tax=Desulfonatronospira thiodismutans ASO3-1 TaxID=555779 RepID=D6SKK4_9BACT|nr:UDP-N-acetylglucosamine 1-carboxyvinyltransferase [Desulfonatronospira thiodismutans]EFI35215.1 UDP-N-acetylglucosamine 1-carboxyvinyltransferase [Desulfonatronospira thiodismutans ASO3-1]
MYKLVIEGGSRLEGEIRISGSKNASLPILMASIMADSDVILENVPGLKDIHTSLKLLTLLGCKSGYSEGSARIQAGELVPEAPYDLVRTMRASVLCLGPLLARLGRAKVALPGGCAIGSRPVDQHLRGLEQMGAGFELDSGYIVGKCKRLSGAHIIFDLPTVGGTENLLMAAALAKGETVLENAAREPEITDLAEFLNACGARISGHGTSVIRVQGVDSLEGCTYRVMSDRIEAGTYMVAAAITHGEVLLTNCPDKELDAVVAKLQEMGVVISPEPEGFRVSSNGDLQGVDVVTLPYPGFPTDMQAQIMALMCVAAGTGTIKETIFENRFLHALELNRMGARIKLSGQSAVVRGGADLVGAPVMASDLRASASLVLAGLRARGKTEVQRIYHLDRGYEVMEKKLEAVGAKISRQKEN